ncbi:MAG: hypothetical protein RL326_60 [Pseudomonadota bacterium]|jgi:DUF1009 family protein
MTLACMNNSTTDTSLELSSPIGLVAGNGRFPMEFAEKARAQGLSIVVLALRGEADPRLEQLAQKFVWMSVGQLGKLVRTLKSNGVKQVAFLGGVTRVNFVDGFRIDWRGLRMLSRMRSFNDDSMLRSIIAEVESSGVQVIAPCMLLQDSVPRRGLLAGKALSGDALTEAQLGWDAARALGALDIGQSVVVRNKTVIAVEAVEGTDATIQRAGAVRGGRGVLVKLAKSIQDLRVDLPAVGTKTLEAMHASNLGTLVVEAGKCLMHDPQAVLEKAIAYDITIVAAERKEDLAIAN